MMMFHLINAAALMEARRHVPVNSIFLDAFFFVMLSKIRLQTLEGLW